jgi:Arm DNA-binding domain
VHEPIRKIVLKDGTVRYRLVVDVGHDGTGRRRQITRTYDKQKEARAELSRIRHQQAGGNYVRPSAVTVSQYLDEYLVGAVRDRRASTKSNYSNAFKPVRERLGSGGCRASLRPTLSSLSTGCLHPAGSERASPALAWVPDLYASPSVGCGQRSRWLSGRAGSRAMS